MEVKILEPKESHMRFLDIELTLSLYTVCWEYKPRAQMRVLSYDSARSKLVKQCITLSCMSAALTKSCVRSAPPCFVHQVTRLEASGCPMSLLIDVAESLQKALKNLKKNRNDVQPKSRPVAIP